MPGRVCALCCLVLLEIPASIAAAVPALVRTLPTGEFEVAVLRPDGSSLAVTPQGVIRQNAAGSQRYVARLRGNQNAVLARHGSTFGVTTFADNAPATLHAAAFDLYDESGTRLFRLEKPEATEFVISEDGRWVVGIAGGDEMRESKLHLFDAKGAEVTTWNVSYLSDLTLPAGGTRFFAASRGVLQAYSYMGGEPHPFGRFEAFGLGAGGRYVALCGAGSVALYQEEKLVFTAPSEISQPRSVAVSPDGKSIGVAGEDRLELFDCEKGTRVCTVTSGRPDLRFVSLDLGGGADAILAGLDCDPGAAAETPRHTSGAVFLLNREGQLLWRDDFQYTTWNARVPAVRFLASPGRIEVELASEIRSYSLPERP